MIKNKIANKEGSVLVASLIIATILTTFGMGYLRLLVVEAWNTGKTHRLNSALHIAESGVEEAIWEIKHNGLGFAGWSGNGTVGNPYTKTASLTASGEVLGEYTVNVADVSSAFYEIEAIGKALVQGSLEESRTVKVVLERFNPWLVLSWQEK